MIGTGACAIQFVPQIARRSAQLDVFQRTPPWITPKPDRAIGPRERRLHERFPAGGSGRSAHAVYWGLEGRGAGFAGDPKLMKGLELQAHGTCASRSPIPDCAPS